NVTVGYRRRWRDGRTAPLMHPGTFHGGAAAGVVDSKTPAWAVRSGCPAPGISMRETITIELLRRLQQAPPTAVLDIYDTKVPRLVLRVRPTGTHSYRLVLGRGR